MGSFGSTVACINEPALSGCDDVVVEVVVEVVGVGDGAGAEDVCCALTERVGSSKEQSSNTAATRRLYIFRIS